MGVEWNKRLILVTVLGLIVVTVLTKGIYDYNADPELPEPAVITEPLETYYVGNVALDMPESWKMSNLSLTFYLTSEKDSPEIKFDDGHNRGDKEAAETLDEALASAEKVLGIINEEATIITKKDITESLGRPAAIFISKSEPISYAGLASEINAAPDLNNLELSLFIVERQAVLEFTYSEKLVWPDAENEGAIISARQRVLTDWALAFLPRYQWEGANVPHPGNYLATKRGRIAYGDQWPELHYSLTAFFRQKSDDSLNNMFISLDTGPGKSSRYSRTNRAVGGHPGNEYKSLTNMSKGLEKLKIWQPKRIFMNLRWRDLSPGPFHESSPKYTANYMGLSEAKGGPDPSYVIGTWDMMLNSIRTVSVPQKQD